MDPLASPQLTALLNQAQAGDRDAAERALAHLHGELRRLAGVFMADQRIGHTLQPTALVNEAWLRVSRKEGDWACRGQFFRFASQAMRSVLVDHARRRESLKRGGGAARTALDDALQWFEERHVDLLAYNEALDALDAIDPRKRRVLELRIFGGLDMATIAEVVGISPATAERDWAMGRAWVHRHTQA